MPANTAATARRNKDGSTPTLKPTAAMAIPTPAKDAASPAASANGPHTWRSTTPKRTIGKIGSTQGDNVDNAPAA